MFQVDVGNKREEWMTELPPAQAASLGLGPRKFRIREGPDMSDRSCLTDTPAQKAQKQRDSVSTLFCFFFLPKIKIKIDSIFFLQRKIFATRFIFSF